MTFRGPKKGKNTQSAFLSYQYISMQHSTMGKVWVTGWGTSRGGDHVFIQVADCMGLCVFVSGDDNPDVG